MRSRITASVLQLSALGCLSHCESGGLDLGSAVVWAAGLETGDFSEWTGAPGSGGTYTNSNDSVVAVSRDQAHTGQYSIKLTSTASLPTGPPDAPVGGGVFKLARFPSPGYYSAWYYLPRAYSTNTAWTVMTFGNMGDTGGSAALIDIRLQSLPSGTITLAVFDHRPEDLSAPLPNPPPSIPIGRWFQLECLYELDGATGGRLTIWLDGALAYDLSRPADVNVAVYFSPCSLANDLTPPASELYIDDVAVSLVRVTPRGTLTWP